MTSYLNTANKNEEFTKVLEKKYSQNGFAHVYLKSYNTLLIIIPEVNIELQCYKEYVGFKIMKRFFLRSQITHIYCLEVKSMGYTKN